MKRRHRMTTQEIDALSDAEVISFAATHRAQASKLQSEAAYHDSEYSKFQRALQRREAAARKTQPEKETS